MKKIIIACVLFAIISCNSENYLIKQFSRQVKKSIVHEDKAKKAFKKFMDKSGPKLSIRVTDNPDTLLIDTLDLYPKQSWISVDSFKIWHRYFEQDTHGEALYLYDSITYPSKWHCHRITDSVKSYKVLRL